MTAQCTKVINHTTCMSECAAICTQFFSWKLTFAVMIIGIIESAYCLLAKSTATLTTIPAFGHVLCGIQRS